MAKSNPIYLDYAAATPLSPKVLSSMMPYLKLNFYNPSAIYRSAVNVQKDLSNARKRVAEILGAKDQEIVFTAGASEANNLAIKGVMDLHQKANIVISSIEHESVITPARNYDYKLCKVKSDGRIDLEHLEKLIDGQTVLVSVMHANNEIGVVQPLSRIGQIIERKRLVRKNKLPLYFHSDAAQSPNYLDLHTAKLKVDLLSLNGSKIYGPKQSGALFIKSGVLLSPQIEGGGQEFNLRSGTENVAGIIGFSKALKEAQVLKDSESKRLLALKQLLLNKLSDNFSDAEFNGSLKFSLPNNLSVYFPAIDNERLLLELDELGIMAAAGSACSASKNEASHVLKAIGKSDSYARSVIRFSLGRGTSEKQLLETIKALKKIIK